MKQDWRKKITIINETVWPTSMLRPFIVRAARDEFDSSTPNRKPRPLQVTITYAHDHYACSGHAFYHSGRSTVSVPNPQTFFDKEKWALRKRTAADPPAKFPVHDFVHVLGHEFAHNIGVKHAMMGRRYKNRSKEVVEAEYPWVTTLPVPVLREKKVKPLDVKRAEKVAHLATAVARWQRRSKLAATKLKYWQRRLRAYERLTEQAAAKKGVDRGPEIVDGANPVDAR